MKIKLVDVAKAIVAANYEMVGQVHDYNFLPAYQKHAAMSAAIHWFRVYERLREQAACSAA